MTGLNQNPVVSKSQRNKSRWMLIALALIFIIPVVGPLFWTPKSFVNHGDLIQPHARSLASLVLLDDNGQNTGSEAFKGKWTMLILDDASCNAICQRNLYNIRQVRLTQGRRMQRVQLAWILLSGSTWDIDRQIKKEYPLVEIYTIARNHQQTINELFKTQLGKPEDSLQRVYFIDPLGNLVLSFDPEQNPKGIQKDLGRLLKVSKVGENQD